MSGTQVVLKLIGLIVKKTRLACIVFIHNIRGLKIPQRDFGPELARIGKNARLNRRVYCNRVALHVAP